MLLVGGLLYRADAIERFSGMRTELRAPIPYDNPRVQAVHDRRDLDVRIGGGTATFGAGLAIIGLMNWWGTVRIRAQGVQAAARPQ